jgi:hypothetical protein
MPTLTVPQRRLAKLRRDDRAFLDRWVAAGNKVTHYECGHCHRSIETPQPDAGHVTSDKSYWDSMKTCTVCGSLNFVLVYPDGRTEVRTVN